MTVTVSFQERSIISPYVSHNWTIIFEFKNFVVWSHLCWFFNCFNIRHDLHKNNKVLIWGEEKTCWLGLLSIGKTLPHQPDCRVISVPLLYPQVDISNFCMVRKRINVSLDWFLVSLSLVLWGFFGAGVHPSGALGTGRETSDLPWLSLMLLDLLGLLQ